MIHMSIIFFYQRSLCHTGMVKYGLDATTFIDLSIPSTSYPMRLMAGVRYDNIKYIRDKRRDGWNHVPSAASPSNQRTIVR